MSLSSNSIIHFTKKKAYLKSILEDNFHISYSPETVFFGSQYWNMHVPMVCFCDIPLSEVKNHIEKYGSYGIGLTKDWASRKGLNPVLYVEPNSLLSTSFMKSLNEFVLTQGSNTSDYTPEAKAHLDILRYMKNYQGELTINRKKINNYRFSDEREWRYVPSYETKCRMIVGDKNFIKIEKYVVAKVKPLRLVFEPNDIKYIILREENEIDEFINILDKAKGKYVHKDVKRLNTRIITTSQIMTDF